MKIEASFLYTATHEWVKIEGTHAKVGISDYAQEHLGDIVFVDLPESGRTVDSGEETAVVESVKGVGTIYAPFAGKIINVNDNLSDNPGDLNAKPFEEWLFELEIEAGADTSSLLSPEAYKELCEKEEQDG